MIREKVVENLQRVLGAEGNALLSRFDLLKPLVKQMVIHEAIAEDIITEEQLEKARVDLLRHHGFSGIKQWPNLIERLGSTESEVLLRLQPIHGRKIIESQRMTSTSLVKAPHHVDDTRCRS